jgi:hypothetical protein
MIKEKELNIKIVGRNLDKYRSLGYTCNVGDNILININDIQKNSHARITAICDNCGYESNISIQKYNKNFNNQEIYTCKKCAQIKNKKTNNEKYGADYPLQNKKIYNKVMKTNIEKYGVKNVFQLDEVKNKIKITNNIKYGVDYPQQNVEILNKSNKTNELKYGFSRPAKNSIIKEKCKRKIPISSIKENELLEFIKQNYKGEIIKNDRKILSGKELDIYLPDLNLAFEYNGLYWHSNIYKDDMYHLNKMINCLNKNVQLIHIWEDEWIYNNAIVKNKIIKILKNIKVDNSHDLYLDLFLYNDNYIDYDIINILKPIKYNIKGNRKFIYDKNLNLPYIFDCGKILLKKKLNFHD